MKTKFFEEEVKKLKENNLNWNIRYLETASQPHAIVDGKKVLMLNTNNYLGLATHPKVVKAAIEATKKYGAGAGAVPVIAGSFHLTKKFQEKLAKFKKVEATLLCQTGFAVNGGLIPQLVDEKDFILSDSLNHGSIIDGTRLSKAQRLVYNHNDMNDLEKKLIEAEKANAKKILIITDGVFSMDGDIAKLPEIVKLAEEFNAMTYVDDCHGEGVLGEGKGIVAHFKLQGKIDIEGGSMSKGFGVFGGTLAGSKELIEFAYNKSRTYLLSTAHPPGVIAACIAAIEVAEKEKKHVRNLWKNTNYFRKEVQKLGFNTGKSETPIIPLIIGDAGKAQEMAKKLYEEESIFVTPIVYPMVARELSRIRIQMNALLSKKDIDFSLNAIERIGKKLKII